MSALFYLALLLGAYVIWHKGWAWTPETSRLRDLAGIIALSLAVLILAIFISIPEVCIAAQTVELDQSAVTIPVSCE